MGEDLGGVGGDATEHDGDGHRVHDFDERRKNVAQSSCSNALIFDGSHQSFILVQKLTCDLFSEVAVSAARSEATAGSRVP